tara:strand:+ start:1103 stop:1852 length:750 start_codon:yes stop_codon:yes gene_type:complete
MYSPYPIIIKEKFLSKNLCNKIIKQIEINNKFDDHVMNGRGRINKGSKNFINFVNSSKEIYKFYKDFNNLKFFKKFFSKLQFHYKSKKKWHFNVKISRFSKLNYGLQKGNKLTVNFQKEKKTNVLNLDMDFSCSSYGYQRSAHRDRETRVVNFLIYLNTLKKNDGASFQIFKFKKNQKSQKSQKNFPRFPKKNQVQLSKSLIPSAGKLIIFLSTPDSYHGVSKLISKTKKRFFIYGSYSLNKPVIWKYN